MPKGRPKRLPRNYTPPAPPGSIAERILAVPLPEGPIEYLSIEQVCKIENCARTVLRNKVHRGLLPAGLPFSERGHIRRWPAHWFTIRDRLLLEDARKPRRSA